MTAVNAHEIWERFVEDRLVAAIDHDPGAHFLAEQNVKGVKHVSLCGFSPDILLEAAIDILISADRRFDCKSQTNG